MGKTVDQRVNDTLTIIDNYAPAWDDAARQQITTWIANLFPRLNPQDLQQYKTLSKSMSVSSNMGIFASKTVTGDDAARAKRRAIFLLWTAVGKSTQTNLLTGPKANAAMTMPTGQVNAAMDEAMRVAGLVGSQRAIQAKFNELKAQPATFLKNNPLSIGGSTAGADKFAAPGAGPYTNVVRFYFLYDVDSGRFKFAQMPKTGTVSINPEVVSVPAIHWAKIPGAIANVANAPNTANFAGIRGCELTGADFMLTTQFTGCSWVWTNVGGTIRAAHITPSVKDSVRQAQFPPYADPTLPGQNQGQQMARRIMANGQMHNAANAALNVFGAGAGNINVLLGNNAFPNQFYIPQGVQIGNTGRTCAAMYIIGVDKPGSGWRFYTQLLDSTWKVVIPQTGRIF
jgi:hypothetical protein